MARSFLNRKIFMALAILFAGSFVGCDGGATNPISTALSSETGYKIQLSSSIDTVSVGGKAIITATILEPDGSPIRDDETVFFASSEGGSFSDNPISTKNGQATVAYTSSDTPMRFDNITASCHGAIATINIWILPQSF